LAPVQRSALARSGLEFAPVSSLEYPIVEASIITSLEYPIVEASIMLLYIIEKKGKGKKQEYL
jgi:hypothetical protein